MNPHMETKKSQIIANKTDNTETKQRTNKKTFNKTNLFKGNKKQTKTRDNKQPIKRKYSPCNINKTFFVENQLKKNNTNYQAD